MSDPRHATLPSSVVPVQAGRMPRQRSGSLLGLLTAGIPLTLLLDLASPDGPDSRAILESERRMVERVRLRSA